MADLENAISVLYLFSRLKENDALLGVSAKDAHLALYGTDINYCFGLRLQCLRLDWKSSMIKQNPNPSPIEKMWFGLSCFGGDKRDRTADLSGGKRRKARRRRVLIERQEVSGARTAGFHETKTEDQSPRFLSGGDKRDRTADLLNAIQKQVP